MITRTISTIVAFTICIVTYAVPKNGSCDDSFVKGNFLESLEKTGFNTEIIDELKCEKMDFSGMHSFLKNSLANQEEVDSSGHDFLHFEVTVELGELQRKLDFFVVLGTGKKARQIFAETIDFLFFLNLNTVQYDQKFSDPAFIANTFNSTELSISEDFGVITGGGYCFDSLTMKEHNYHVNLAVKRGKELIRPNNRLYFDILNLNAENKKTRPVLILSTSPVYQYTYGVNAKTGYPDLQRYREVFFDLNADRIIKDELISEQHFNLFDP